MQGFTKHQSYEIIKGLFVTRSINVIIVCTSNKCYYWKFSIKWPNYLFLQLNMFLYWKNWFSTLWRLVSAVVLVYRGSLKSFLSEKIVIWQPTLAKIILFKLMILRFKMYTASIDINLFHMECMATLTVVRKCLEIILEYNMFLLFYLSRFLSFFPRRESFNMKRIRSEIYSKRFQWDTT